MPLTISRFGGYGSGRRKVEESEGRFCSSIENAPVATCLFELRNPLGPVRNTLKILT